MPEAPEKPSVHLLRPGLPTAEDLAKLYTALTGREATAEELDELRAILAQNPIPPQAGPVDAPDSMP